MDVFRHLLQHAFKQDACLEPRHLEILVLILRSDVLHAFGGALAACPAQCILSCTVRLRWCTHSMCVACMCSARQCCWLAFIQAGCAGR